MIPLLGLIIFILIIALFWYGVDWLAVPNPFNKICKAILAVIAIIHIYIVLTGGAGLYYYL